jgi:O-antigen ligase
VHLISERPWFGHGAGEQVFMETYHTADAPPSSQRFYHPHQYWLGMLFAYGVVGAALQVVMWVMLSVALMRRAVAGPDDGGRGMAAMVLSLIVFLQFVGLVDCLPGVVGLAAILTVPAALVATRVKAA